MNVLDKSYIFNLICLRHNLINPEQIIEDVVFKTKMDVKDTLRLCKVTSNNVAALLNESHIPNVIMNTNSIIGSYEHVFVIVYFRTDEMNYYLIDLAYDQFIPKERRHLLPQFKSWPADILRSSEAGRELFLDITEKGYTLLNNDKFRAYLNSFGNVLDDVEVEETILKEKMKRIKRF